MVPNYFMVPIWKDGKFTWPWLPEEAAMNLAFFKTVPPILVLKAGGKDVTCPGCDSVLATWVRLEREKAAGTAIKQIFEIYGIECPCGWRTFDEPIQAT
jgi:hypothetical protein